MSSPSTSGFGSVNAASNVFFVVAFIIVIVLAAVGFVWIIAPGVFLLAALLVGRIKYRHKIRVTGLIYSWWVSIVVTGFGPRAYEVHPALPFVLICISYLSFLWTSLAITNIIYATVAGVSAVRFLPAKTSRRTDSIDVLMHVWTTSLGSICYGSSTPFGPVSRILKTPWPTLRSFAFKHTFYNVAVYGMDYDSAANDLQPRIAGLKVASLLDQCIIPQLLIVNAVCGGLMAAALARVFVGLNHHYIVISVLGTMQVIFTIGAAAESALGSMFVAMAHDPEGFAQSNPVVAKQIGELYGEMEEMKTVV
ncbi:hypothetical protein BGZ93_008785 [Podila epicladia]|nr:hypothetical protein BGZ93_008785 [Podila epicladia]